MGSVAVHKKLTFYEAVYSSLYLFLIKRLNCDRLTLPLILKGSLFHAGGARTENN